VGRRIEGSSASEAAATGSPVLQLRKLTGGNVHGIDLDVRPGEIVGIAGITGSGREHVLGLIAGQLPYESGEVIVNDQPLQNYEPRSGIAAGVAFVPADRSVRGTIGPMNVRENLSLCDLRPHFAGGRLRRKRETTETNWWIEKLSIKTSSTETLIGSLSGGNQQKVMFGKALRLNPKLLLLDEPTQGIDVGAKDQIHALIDSSSNDGVATLVASTDTDELVRLCHRVVVLINGRIAATLTGADITAEHIEHTQLQTTRRDS
jgi:ribose transport system ATP-binding protein